MSKSLDQLHALRQNGAGGGYADPHNDAQVAPPYPPNDVKARSRNPLSRLARKLRALLAASEEADAERAVRRHQVTSNARSNATTDAELCETETATLARKNVAFAAVTEAVMATDAETAAVSVQTGKLAVLDFNNQARLVEESPEMDPELAAMFREFVRREARVVLNRSETATRQRRIDAEREGWK